MKYFIRIPALFIIIVLIEVSLISIALGSVPNNMELVFVHNIEMFTGLVNINPAVAIKLILINQPLLIFEKIDFSTGTQMWGLYVMPASALVLLGLGLFFVRLPLKHLTRYQCGWVVIASICLLISVLYLRVQACCTANPAWLVDVVLLSRVFSAELNNVLWQQAYLMLSPWFNTLQYMLASASFLVLYYNSRKSFKKRLD